MGAERKVANPALGHAEKAVHPDASELDWDDFRVFTAIARAGSYTSAARQLKLGQPAISRRMARLERAVGARLFDRCTHGIELTCEGTKLLNFASGAEVMLARGVAGVRTATKHIDSDCKISIGDGLATYWLTPFLSPFLENNPNIGLTVFTAHDPSNAQAPIFDLQVHYTHPISSDRVAVRLATMHFVLYAAPEYIMQYGTPVQPKDLRQHRILDFSARLMDKGSLASWAGLDDNSAVMTNSSVVLAEILRNGGGLGLLPTYASIVFPTLVPVMPEMHYHAPLFVCFEREAAMKPAVRVVIDYLKGAVFDVRRMPWFSHEFIRPSSEWETIYEDCLARASLHGVT